MKIKEVWDVYYKSHVLRKVIDRERMEQKWNLHLLPVFAEREILSLAQVDIDDYIEGRMNGSHPPVAALSTARGEVIALKTALNYLNEKTKQLTLEERREFPNFEYPPQPQGRVRWLDDDEIDGMFEQAAIDRPARYGARLSRLERFLWLGLETGAREMAIRKLKWPMVDFEKDEIDYRKIDAKLSPVQQQRTNKKRKACVPMSPALREVLLRERTMQEEAGVKTDYVLDVTTTVYDAVIRTALRIGITDISPHTLRHTFATRRLAAGVDLWDVAGLLADTPETVRKTYGHHVPANLKRGVMLGTIGDRADHIDRSFKTAAE